MSDTHVSGFAQTINKIIDWFGGNSAFTSYLTSSYTTLYGVMSLDVFLGLGGLTVAVFTAFVNRNYKRRMAAVAERDLDLRERQMNASSDIPPEIM